MLNLEFSKKKEKVLVSKVDEIRVSEIDVQPIENVSPTDSDHEI